MINISLFKGDCLEVMPSIPDGSVDMVMADPPQGRTACKWDNIIPLKPMWEQLKGVIKPNGAIVITACQPFTTMLISSNMKMFKYEWVWEKDRPTNPLLVKKQPMRYHENVLVFYEKLPTYNFIMENKKPENIRFDHTGMGVHRTEGLTTKLLNGDGSTTKIYPRSIQKFRRVQRILRATQKPVALMEYFIKTYTNEDEIVLDFCMGSGTTGVACKNLNRNFIGIELGEEDNGCFEVAQKRIEEHQEKVK